MALATGILLCCAPGVQAQILDYKEVKPLSRYDVLSDERFNEKAILYKGVLDSDPSTAYEIRLPPTWTAGSTSASASQDGKAMPWEAGEDDDKERRGGILDLRARYFGAPSLGLRSRVEIHVEELTRLISAKNWFANYVISNGIPLEGVDIISKNKLEALYVTIDQDISYAVRVRCELNGTKIILLSYYTPVQFMKKEKVIQEKVVNSFKFENPKKPLSEWLVPFSLMDIIYLSYPKTWRIPAPRIYSFDDIEMNLVYLDEGDEDEKRWGQAAHVQQGVVAKTEIGIKILSHDSDKRLVDEVESLKGVLKENGMAVEEVIDVPIGYEVKPSVTYNRVEVYKVVGVAQKVVDHEFWIAILSDDGYFFILSMLSIGRDADFSVWARNREAFEIMVENITTVPPTDVSPKNLRKNTL